MKNALWIRVASSSRCQCVNKYAANYSGLLAESYDLLLGYADYNYFRSYDPSTGRYLESDPIGLGGGLNTYAYDKLSPIMFIDPNGLYWSAVDAYRPEYVLRERLPEPEYDPKLNCRLQCFIDYLNPIPDNITERIVGKQFGELAGASLKRINKGLGAFDLGSCLDTCRKKYPSCDAQN